jgi:steroid 5-alpha reductase family enzyme
MTLRQRHFIDSHKCANAAAIVAMIAIYDAWENTTAWVYLALHGTYGFLWTLKSYTFGDKQWDRPTRLPMGLAIWGILTLYWVAPWMITSRDIEAPPWYLGLAIAIYAFGVFLHFASDMQKHMHLAHRPGQLLCEGLWARVRNPNYFGELLIYCGFTMLAMHWLPLLLLGVVIGGLWVPNMIKKDRSLSRYPAFAEWKAKSKLFVPFVV